MTKYLTTAIYKYEKNPSAQDAYIVRVHCPICGKSHTHGIPGTGETFPFHRVADCDSAITNKMGYSGYMVERGVFDK